MQLEKEEMQMGKQAKITVIHDEEDHNYCAVLAWESMGPYYGEVFAVTGVEIISMVRQARDEARRRGIPYIFGLDDPPPPKRK